MPQPDRRPYDVIELEKARDAATRCDAGVSHDGRCTDCTWDLRWLATIDDRDRKLARAVELFTETRRVAEMMRDAKYDPSSRAAKEGRERQISFDIVIEKIGEALEEITTTTNGER